MVENQLVIRGRQTEDDARAYLHRGIAARQFNRAFVLADGMQVSDARLANGLLEIGLTRPEPQKLIRRIEVKG
jgi:HSP20 family molecular chaperone IbpA